MLLPVYVILCVLSLVATGALTQRFMAINDRRTWLQLTILLAWAQFAGSTYIAIQSSSDAISKVACLGGFFGFWITIALFMMDALGFAWVKFRQRKLADPSTKKTVSRFIGMRVVTHILAGVNFAYAVVICTA